MKLLFHSKHTPLLVFNKGIEACNPLQNKFCFLDCRIGNINNPFRGNTKLFMNDTWSMTIFFFNSFLKIQKKELKKTELHVVEKLL